MMPAATKVYVEEKNSRVVFKALRCEAVREKGQL
jgi:hypothetical protein